MRRVITLLTSGTRGDVQPLVALGAGLQRRGYAVRVLTHEPFRGLVAAHGLGFVPLDGNPNELFARPELRAALTYDGGLLRSARSALAYLRAARPLFARMLASAWQGSQGSGALVVSLPTTWGDQIAEALGIPCVWALTQPLGRTRAFPSPLQPFGLSLGPWYNALTHALAEHAVWQPWRDMLGRWRRDALGLAGRTGAGWAARTAARGDLFLFGYSPRVAPRPPDWPGRFHVTGYWLLERPAGWRPDPSLLRFLEAGPALYAGFGGAMAVPDERLLAQVVRGLALAGQRAVLLVGAGAHQRALPPHVYPLGAAPHDWLLPQVGAAVHHAGAGTLAAALCAGIPSVCVPFGADQFFWSGRAARLGCAPAPIPARALSAERLAEAIDAAVRQPIFKQRAAGLGQQIAAERGVERAADLIESHL
ncbi:glycosyltransferase [Kouleothrix sp.]|uniref:glycosyltransferase n=1 Tax=Kouleothrix sp. TaxID=2779161 RepID=UPI00391D5EEB